MAVDAGADAPPRMDLASSLHGRCAAARSPSWQHRVRLWVVGIDPSGWHAEPGQRKGLCSMLASGIRDPIVEIGFGTLVALVEAVHQTFKNQTTQTAAW
jgi:hypothetical protein